MTSEAILVSNSYRFRASDGGKSSSRYPRQHNDCTVRACAIAFSLTYNSAYKLLKDAERKASTGFSLGPWLHSLTLTGYSIQKVDTPNENIRSFVPTHLTETYIVIVPKHCFTLLDGVIYDSFPPFFDTPILAAYRITNLNSGDNPK